MRFIINIVCFLFLLPLIATAQTYKYIGVENGLSNRRIFDIQKDSIGYMWFLTNEGIDRYNGKDIKHYSDYPFMHLLYSQLLVCQRVCLQNTVCLICK